jgi:hypothetical protein
MNEWISIQNKLPDIDGDYFSRCYGYVFIGTYNKKLNKWRDKNNASGLDQEVTHWLPIPPLT